MAHFFLPTQNLAAKNVHHFAFLPMARQRGDGHGNQGYHGDLPEIAALAQAWQPQRANDVQHHRRQQEKRQYLCHFHSQAGCKRMRVIDPAGWAGKQNERSPSQAPCSDFD
jgi:hypothetical protein